MDNLHYHKDENGFMTKCYHSTKNNLLNGSFWLGLTIGFPIEHFIWEKLPVFRDITHFLGL